MAHQCGFTLKPASIPRRTRMGSAATRVESHHWPNGSYTCVHCIRPSWKRILQDNHDEKRWAMVSPKEVQIGEDLENRRRIKIPSVGEEGQCFPGLAKSARPGAPVLKCGSRESALLFELQL